MIAFMLVGSSLTKHRGGFGRPSNEFRVSLFNVSHRFTITGF